MKKSLAVASVSSVVKPLKRYNTLQTHKDKIVARENGERKPGKKKTRNLAYDAIANDVTHQFGFSAFQYRLMSDFFV